jgi:hypothetical protein
MGVDVEWKELGCRNNDLGGRRDHA